MIRSADGLPRLFRRGTVWWAYVPARHPVPPRRVSLRTNIEAVARAKLAELTRAVAPRGERRRPLWVYFVRAGTHSVKIGSTADLAARLDHIQTHNHEAVTLLGAVPGDSAVEAAIHSRLAPYRLHREWYSYTAKVEHEIRAMLAHRHALADVRPFNAALARSLAGDRRAEGAAAPVTAIDDYCERAAALAAIDLQGIDGHNLS